MGLDLVEFVMAVEEAFDIEIPDEEAEHLTTPGKLKDFVYQQLCIEVSTACLSQRSFYRLRSALVSAGEGEPRMIRPATNWEEIAPPDPARRQWWGELKHSAALPLPGLVRPRWIVRMGWGLALGMGVGVFLSLWTWTPAIATVFAPVSILVTSILFVTMTSRYQVHFRGDLATVGETARFAANISPAKLKKPEEGWTQAEVSRIVDRLIFEQFAAKDFNDESDFVRDLNAG